MNEWAEAYHFVRMRVDAGEQAYVVVPAIDSGRASLIDEPDERLDAASVNDLRTLEAKLGADASPLHGVRIASMHGRLARDSREQIMQRFRAGHVDVLLATTVIEVGVDVPNATVMVVEHAERFGLAQLHQLRGRVGRGEKRSACILIGDCSTPDAAARLAAIADTTDGFALAEKDLELRGPGEMFGARQSGAPPLRVADLVRDRDLLNLARSDAAKWLDRSPSLDQPDEALLKRRLLKTHGRWLGLSDIG
jgi:ATP-dependent DNA helicase RecG